MMSNCKFCDRADELKKKFIPIAQLEASYLCLFKNQYYPGRCIIVANTHHKNLHELPPGEQEVLFRDLAIATKALQNVTQADSISLSDFGDESPHFHFHIASKHRNGFNWGNPYYSEPIGEKYLDDESFIKVSVHIQKELLQIADPARVKIIPVTG